MSETIVKSHNQSVLLYHFVCPAKYRRKIFNKEIVETLKWVCAEIGKRYEMEFIEIGADEDHVHFLIQGVPMQSPKQMIQAVKSITAKEIYKRHPEVKSYLWGGNI